MRRPTRSPKAPPIGTTVGVTASSTDVNGPAVTYSLTGDTSGGGFTINAATGVVTVADGTKINYATAPGHAYTVTVQASDGTLTSSQGFNIAVTAADTTPPTVTITESVNLVNTIGATTTLTFQFSEAVTGFDSSDVIVSKASELMVT